MVRTHIIIADEDMQYLNVIRQYLSEQETKPVMDIFSSREALEAHISGIKNTDVDVILLGESMRSPMLDIFSASAVKVLMLENGGPPSGEYTRESIPAGYVGVRKYQKISALVQTALLAFYDTFPERAQVMAVGIQSTQLVGVYSPVGGSGKTILSLMLAQGLGYRQKKVFYLNCEKIDSTRGILPQDAKISVSQLLEKPKSIRSHLTLRMCTPKNLKFSYVNPAGSSLEWNDLEGKDRFAVFEELNSLGYFDYVILDFDSELTADKTKVLALCNWIVVPFLVMEPLSLNKAAQFLREIRDRPDLGLRRERMLLVANMVQSGTSIHNILEDISTRRDFGQPLDFGTPFAIPSAQAASGVGTLLKGDSRCMDLVGRIVDKILL